MDAKERQYFKTAYDALTALLGYIDAKDAQSEINRSKLRIIKTESFKANQKGGINYSPSAREDEMKYAGKTIKKRKDGRWECRYYQGNKQKSVYGKTQIDCLNALKDALNHLNKTPATDNTYTMDGKTPYGTYLKEWHSLFRVGKLSIDTLKNEEAFMQIITKHIGTLALKSLTPIVLQGFLNKATQKIRQREHLYNVLSLSLKKAFELKLIKSNPIIGVEKPKHHAEERTSMTRQQEQILIDCIKHSFLSYFCLLILYEGMRPSETLALTASDIDLQGLGIKITKSIAGDGSVKKPKTAASVRTIPIFKKSISILETLTMNKDPGERLFNFNLRTAQREFAKICQNAKLNDFSLYSLRHTFITRCAERGVHVKIAQKWAGHSNVSITMQYYTHINREWELENVEKNNDMNEKDDIDRVDF